jgi:hypothetical protein
MISLRFCVGNLVRSPLFLTPYGPAGTRRHIPPVHMRAPRVAGRVLPSSLSHIRDSHFHTPFPAHAQSKPDVSTRPRQLFEPPSRLGKVEMLVGTEG